MCVCVYTRLLIYFSQAGPIQLFKTGKNTGASIHT